MQSTFGFSGPGAPSARGQLAPVYLRGARRSLTGLEGRVEEATQGLAPKSDRGQDVLVVSREFIQQEGQGGPSGAEHI